MLQNFKMKSIALINKDTENTFRYSQGDLVYLISPLTTQLRTSSRKVAIKYVGPIGNLQNCGSSQLFAYDNRWSAYERII